MEALGIDERDRGTGAALRPFGAIRSASFVPAHGLRFAVSTRLRSTRGYSPPPLRGESGGQAYHLAMSKTIYLERSNKELVCHCRCRQAVIAAPVQMESPWTGEGWLFTCMNCRKNFSFARGVLVEESLEELAVVDLEARKGTELELEDAGRWVEWMRTLLKAVEVGKEYVYLDGYFIDVETVPLRFEGWHSRHDLPWVPQRAALEDRSVIDDTIGNEEYWRETAIAVEA